MTRSQAAEQLAKGSATCTRCPNASLSVRAQELGSPEEAQSAFSTSIMLCQNLAEGWLSWGRFCDSHSRAEASGADAHSWVQNAATAYLQVRTAARGTLCQHAANMACA